MNKKITLKEMLDYQTLAVKKMLKDMDSINPMVVVFKNNKYIPFVISGNRIEHKKMIEFASNLNPEYLVTIGEAYQEEKKFDNKEDVKNFQHVHGSLEKRFKRGDERVKEIVVISVYSPDGKLSRILLKDTLEQFKEDTGVFCGFLTVNDVDRVFWDK